MHWIGSLTKTDVSTRFRRQFALFPGILSAIARQPMFSRLINKLI